MTNDLLGDHVNKMRNAHIIEASGGKRRGDVWNTSENKRYYLIYCEDPFGNIIELYSRGTEMMYGNKE
ncbi:hypothetical protein SRABI96_00338 [Peribacillus sp. Bi96]|uniref:hypothetical protein n=1 Tax=Peribacillus sp. Bi96 TaxID=2884273 RepID=UPI001E04D5CC|nr:hypothetical protein [Peribacillus sp. Bi96]CAH0135166.1 hypothetical protein SRABI96_00338 [Peribacillus sp. Bi96]